MNLDFNRVPGTTRQFVIGENGEELERQFIYLDRNTWDMLRVLASFDRTSGSKIIEKLVSREFRPFAKIRQ